MRVECRLLKPRNFAADESGLVKEGAQRDSGGECRVDSGDSANNARNDGSSTVQMHALHLKPRWA